MERLEEKKSTAEKALNRLSEVLKTEKNDITRDAAIQRFEFTFETVWKYAQYYLKHIEGIDAYSPKAVIREMFKLNIFNEQQTELAITMVDDRNLITHTYNEPLADTIFNKLSSYLELLQLWHNTVISKSANIN